MGQNAFDIFILGAGPAGVSAALTARNRGRSVAVLSNDPANTPLAKAHRIDNYPGLPGMSGAELLAAMGDNLKTQDIPAITARATGVMPFGKKLMVSAGQDVYEAKTLILAVGAQQTAKPYPGEAELLGKGVSYCATCDGMLYRGRSVAVLGLGSEGEADAAFLEQIGCKVLYFTGAQAKNIEIRGTDKVTSLVSGDAEYPVDGVFILRDTVAASALLPGLTIDGGHITVGADMETNLPGVFAAGDCTGRPYQIARAVGQGNIAALAADRYIKELEA